MFPSCCRHRSISLAGLDLVARSPGITSRFNNETPLTHSPGVKNIIPARQRCQLDTVKGNVGLLLYAGVGLDTALHNKQKGNCADSQAAHVP